MAETSQQPVAFNIELGKGTTGSPPESLAKRLDHKECTSQEELNQKQAAAEEKRKQQEADRVKKAAEKVEKAKRVAEEQRRLSDANKIEAEKKLQQKLDEAAARKKAVLKSKGEGEGEESQKV